MAIAPIDLARLTSGKAVANTALRWLPFFLPTLALAFDSSTSTLALLLGLAEGCGLATLAVGRWLDAGHERRVMLTSLVLVAFACLIALLGSIWSFAATALLLGLAAGFATVSGHAWISARVSFERRARFIGIYEMSWAAALLIGAPLVALLISAFGWRGPFLALVGASAVAGILVASVDDGERRPTRPETIAKVPLTRNAWLVIGASASVSLAGLTTIVIAGTWLDEVLDVSTGGVGLVAMAFGAAELTASAGSSAFADRIGKRRSMRVSALLLIVGLGIIAITGTSLLVGALGLLVFFVAFEYSIVTSFSLVSEAMPEARGQTLGFSNAIATVSRGIGVISSGYLYEAFGVRGPVALSAVAAVSTFAFLSATRGLDG